MIEWEIRKIFEKYIAFVNRITTSEIIEVSCDTYLFNFDLLLKVNEEIKKLGYDLQDIEYIDYNSEMVFWLGEISDKK